MCGIFGYFGHQKNGADLAIEGLKNLEYRGYDSWGTAYIEGDELKTKKSVGKISQADEIGANTSLAIAHTRWATQGEVSERNAHPHLSPDGKVAVVHNGVIENFRDLKDELGADNFTSDTDTEVIAHLIAKYLHEGADLVSAVRQSMLRLKGRNACLAISTEDDRIVAGRKGSPLILGVGEGEYFLASDIPAFLQHTRTVNYLDDGEMVILSKHGAEFKNIETGQAVLKRDVEIEYEATDATKGDHPHFMLKEILEQKQTIARAVDQDETKIQEIADLIRKARGTYFIGCGTAGNVCHAGTYFFADIAKRHVNYEPASEFKALESFLTPESLVIAISQSGETADVLEALEAAKRAGSKIIAIVNVEGSSIARMADYTLLLNAGPEVAVASTKAATSQMAILLLLAFAIADRLDEGRRLLLDTASKINDMLNPRYIEHIEDVASRIKDKDDMYIIGKSENFPMALEASIKIMEVSYVHAHGFAGGELKHGPIALIEQGTPCLVLIANDDMHDDMVTASCELKTRGAKIICVSPEHEDMCEEWIKVPDVGIASPLVNIIPAQILAYKLAISKGIDPDQPRNLAKSVTVK